MLKKAIGLLCVMGMLVSLAACGTKEVTPDTKQENSSVEQTADETNPTEAAVNNVVTDVTNEPIVDEDNTSGAEDVNVPDEEPAQQPEDNGPVTMDSCLGTYKSDNGDTFTFESDSAGSYVFKDFVWEGAAVEEGLYPNFYGDTNVTEKEDGSLEVMIGVQDIMSHKGYILLLKKDGTIEVTMMSVTTGPLGSAVVFSRQ